MSDRSKFVQDVLKDADEVISELSSLLNNYAVIRLPLCELDYSLAMSKLTRQRIREILEAD